MGKRSREHTGDFADSVDPLYPGLIRRLALVLHDAEEAKDVAQETYVRAWRAWDRFDGTDARAWLFTIGLRLAFNRRRSLMRRARVIEPRGAMRSSWIPTERVDLWRAVGDLRPHERAALLLNVLDGYTQAEIAAMLGAPPGTVASWIAGAKRRMRGALGDAEGSPG
jgi:RNA polymerase sigma-70 factor (ECF subfamily)